jgi:hypothetical protein
LRSSLQRKLLSSAVYGKIENGSVGKMTTIVVTLLSRAILMRVNGRKMNVLGATVNIGRIQSVIRADLVRRMMIDID